MRLGAAIRHPLALVGAFAASLLLAALLVVEQAGGVRGIAPGGAGTAVAGAPIGGPFTLVGADGHAVRSSDFAGRLMVVYFGYTQCPDACPTALNDIANALDMIGKRRADIATLFITVDPERDTPAVVGHYASLFGTGITGLTGSRAQIDAVEHAYKVYAARHPAAGGGYSMDHSSIIYVMDRHGRFLDFIDGAADAPTIAAKLRALDPTPDARDPRPGAPVPRPGAPVPRPGAPVPRPGAPVPKPGAPVH